MPLARHVARVDGHLTIVHFAQTAAPLPGDPDRLPPGLGKGRGIEHQHAIGLSQLLAHFAPQRVSPGGIIPLIPPAKTLPPHTVLAQIKTERVPALPLHPPTHTPT